ncbi:neutral/alkaline non-lysosomal ceramidase N-terminal domain-containing protein [Fuerstiella marisgermanici]|uniref:Neutral ceramidase n=1 Tax=Fuerstiella marisgermanici TaxID=1891926 RepID=A0A1P8WSD5_9PLAN|nr:neutral/alkaline non-lysosomal ceramidase N-terminal domain-containing protein [Fuerstiella marisgermanici]APZ96968.1 Neutral ceramidase [Fuerstiella marisgermanici]
MLRRLCLLIAFLYFTIPVSADPLHVGMAETDITPPMGFPISGYYHERLADGTLDPLKAKAVVFRQGDQSAAFVVGDLTGIDRDLYVEVRRLAAKATGIPEAHIVVSGTHSHTAPDYTAHLYRYLAKKPADRDADAYAAKLVGGMVGAIEEAYKSATPAVVQAGSGQQELPVAFNRRFVMTDGSVKTWQKLDNPKVVKAAGPIDPEIGLLRILSEDGNKTVGVVSNFALHLDTTGGTRWSGDYPYYIEQTLKKAIGEDIVSVFGAGTCGDINHSDPSRAERNKTDVIGNSLGDAIVKALPELKPIPSPTLRVHSTTVQLPLQEVTEHDVKRAQKLIPIAKAGGKVEFFDLVSAYNAIMLDQMQNTPSLVTPSDYLSWGLTHEWTGVGSTLPVEVTTMAIGDDAAIVFLPGEVFVDLGLAIKRASPYRTTLIIELSNCVETAYIPTRAAYAGGSYEVTNSCVQPGSGEMLVEAALSLLRKSAAE